MAPDDEQDARPTVGEMMTRDVIAVRPGDRLEDVARLIREHGVSGFPVVDEEHRVLGVISEGDFLKRYRLPELPAFVEILGGFFPIRSLSSVEEELREIAAVRVEDLMSRPAITARPDWTVQRVTGVMMEHRINRLPVVDDEQRLVGIISRGDVIASMEAWRHGASADA